MCGICGFTGEILDREKILKNMSDVIIHRGPNSDGFFSNKDISSSLAMYLNEKFLFGFYIIG